MGSVVGVNSPSIPVLEAASVNIPGKKKKKDKKRKEKELRKQQSPSNSPGSNISEKVSPTSRNGDEQALSESELESKRAALLAQLKEQMEE